MAIAQDVAQTNDQIAALESRVADLEATYEKRLKELEARLPDDRITIVCFSGDLDRAMAAFIIATGALAMGYECSMYFTFWGLSIIKQQAKTAGKSFMEKMFTMMLPENMDKLGISRLNFAGAGAKMMRGIMESKGVATLDELMETAQELGVRIISCTMAMEIMGVTDEEMRPNLDRGGVGTFLGDALKSKAALFI